MSSLDHGVGSANHHGKSQWFVKGGVPGGSSGNGFVYGSNIPPGYKAAVYAKEPQKTDPGMLSSSFEKINRAHHLQNCHRKEFQPVVDTTYDPLRENFKKKQHFISKQIPGGSDENRMIYGTTEELQRNAEKKTLANYEQKKPKGFMYGTDAATNVGLQRAGTKPNGALFLEQRNESEQYKSKLAKLASDRDEFLSRYYEERAKQRMSQAEEKRKDLEMLTKYEPWGKPGAGAPKNLGESEKIDARVTKNADRLVSERYEPLAIGGPGGGAPNRTESGKVLTRLREDRELSFPRYGPESNAQPKLRYGSKGDGTYRKELDDIVESSMARKRIERQQSFEEEWNHVNHDPFGKQGAGAPLKDERGKVKAGFPTTLSKNIEELRGVEPRHPHAYNQNMQGEERDEHDPWKFREKVTIYDPWGKGCGAPVRDKFGRLQKRGNDRTSQNSDLDGLGISIGKSGGGAPIKDADGKTMTKKHQTLVRDAQGQSYQRDFSPKGFKPYDPFGKEGGGAPVKGRRAQKTYSTTTRREVEAKQEYLKTLQNMTDEQRARKRLEHEEILNSGEDVASWLKQGVVGQPKYNPVTKEIIGNPKGHSDVTLQKLHIVRQKNENSGNYHRELEALAEERYQQRRREKENDQKQGVEHVQTMNSVWGRPGAGAPLNRENVAAARRHKVGIESADGRFTFREA